MIFKIDIPAHSNQDVFIVSYSPRQIEIGEGICHRIQENNVWNIFAATGTGQKLKANYFSPTVAVIHILNYYRFFCNHHNMRYACSPMGALRNTKAVETLGQWDTWQFYFDSHVCTHCGFQDYYG